MDKKGTSSCFEQRIHKASFLLCHPEQMSSAISDILKIKLNPGAMRNRTKITYSY